DLDGRIAAMNPRGEQIAGAPKTGSVIGRPYLDLIHPDDREQVAERLRAAMAGERVEMEFRGFGERGHYFSTKIPLRNDRGEVEKLIGVVIDITQRKEQEIELLKARETLEDAIESLPDGFALWDPEDRLITCNTRFKEYNRMTADVLEPGITWWEFMRTAARRGQYPEVAGGDVEEWVRQLRRELDEEGRTREFGDADGRWFRAIARRTRQGGGLVGIRADITRYKQMEDVLRDSEALVRQVLEACPVPILMTRLDGEIIYESPAGRELFGRRTTDEPDYTLRAWADLSDREAYLSKLREHGQIDEYEALLRRSDGSVFHGAISARLIRFRGEDVVVSSTRDLTERRAVEAEMRRQREALYQSEKLGAMGQLLASVAHELNNPLSVVVGQSLLLQETAEEPHIVERAAKIGNAADRCARIVKTFLAMARQQPTEMASVSLNQVVDTALEVTGYVLRSHDIDVVVELAADLPPVWADADQLNQVLTNLIVNAQQALEGQAPPRRVKIRTAYEPGDTEVVLDLSDNGPGMPPEVRSRIFEPFFTTKDKGSGTGIGLAVSHRILATHGGTISCDSTPGRGTTFSIRLPANPPESGAIEKDVACYEKPARLRVLVVDDEPDVADVIAELLRADGHSVRVAGSGQLALECIAEEEFDLVFSDMRMPGLDGPVLYGRLAEIRPELVGRVAFITGDTLSPKARQFLEASDCPRLEKPVTLTELREMVDRLKASSAKPASMPAEVTDGPGDE
ncbi:MAG TPA: ATP-binding protein, partial [Arenicellales bacterium]|nr:ATP-binding protein [Arenicellales bacterium]